MRRSRLTLRHDSDRLVKVLAWVLLRFSRELFYLQYFISVGVPCDGSFVFSLCIGR